MITRIRGYCTLITASYQIPKNMGWKHIELLAINCLWQQLRNSFQKKKECKCNGSRKVMDLVIRINESVNNTEWYISIDKCFVFLTQLMTSLSNQ